MLLNRPKMNRLSGEYDPAGAVFDPCSSCKCLISHWWRAQIRSIRPHFSRATKLPAERDLYLPCQNCQGAQKRLDHGFSSFFNSFETITFVKPTDDELGHVLPNSSFQGLRNRQMNLSLISRTKNFPDQIPWEWSTLGYADLCGSRKNVVNESFYWC